MKLKFEKYQKRRLISSYISVIISISLVLFLLGLLGVLGINSQKVTNHFKEKMKVSIFIKSTAKQIEINQLTKKLQLSDEVKSVSFVSKEKAAELYASEIGEDFIKFLGTNPLQDAIDIYINADYVNIEKIVPFLENIENKNYVEEIVYDRPLIHLLNENIRKIGFWFLIICSFLVFVATLLINNSIRLTIYAKRFNIKTMQMVGATRAFIRRPFLFLNLKLGFIASLLAIIATGTVLYFIDQAFPSFRFIESYTMIGYLSVGILCFGMLLTYISTFIATQRFLSLQTDELYY